MKSKKILFTIIIAFSVLLISLVSVKAFWYVVKKPANSTQKTPNIVIGSGKDAETEIILSNLSADSGELIPNNEESFDNKRNFLGIGNLEKKEMKYSFNLNWHETGSILNSNIGTLKTETNINFLNFKQLHSTYTEDNFKSLFIVQIEKPSDPLVLNSTDNYPISVTVKINKPVNEPDLAEKFFDTFYLLDFQIVISLSVEV